MADKSYRIKINTQDVERAEKLISKTGGELKKINDNEVVVTLGYDDKELNRGIQKLYKESPTLAVQLEYEINKEALEKEKSKLKNMTLTMNEDSLIRQINVISEQYSKMLADDAPQEEIDQLAKRMSKLYATFFEMNRDQDEGLKKLSKNARELYEDIPELAEGDAFKIVSEKQYKDQIHKIEILKEKRKELISSGANEDGVYQAKIAMEDLMDLFSQFTASHSKSEINLFWDDIKNKISDGDEELLLMLKHLGLITDESNELKSALGGNVKSGGLIGDNKVLLATQKAIYQTKDGEVKNRLNDTLLLKERLDQAAESGVNVSRILSVLYDDASNSFMELQEKSPGKILGDVFGNNQFVNPEIFEATDEEISKLIKDLTILNELGISTDIHPGNISYKKGKGFSFFDLDIDSDRLFKSNEGLIEDLQNGLLNEIQDFYKRTEDSVGEDKAKALGEKFSKFFSLIVENLGKSTAVSSADMKNVLDKAYKIGDSIGDSMAEGMRDRIGAHSEADEFVDIADDAINGIVNEVDRRIGDVKNAGKALADGLSESFGDELQSSLISLYNEAINKGAYFSNSNKDVEIGARINNGKISGDIDYSEANKGRGHVGVPNGEGDTIWHSHYFQKGRDNLSFSYGDINQIVKNKFDEAILMCGEELLTMDISKISEESRQQMNDEIRHMIQNVLLMYGAKMNDDGKILRGDLSDELSNEAVYVINNLLSEILYKYGGTLSSQIKQGDSYINNVGRVGQIIPKQIKDVLSQIEESYSYENGSSIIDIISNAFLESRDQQKSEASNIKKYALENLRKIPILSSNQDNILSGTTTLSQQFDNEVQQNLVMLENYKNTVAEIGRLKLEPETDETKAKLEELNKLADYFASKITVIRSENGGEVNTSMMLGWGASGGWSERLKRDYSEEQRKDFLNVAKDRTGLQISKVTSEFHGISDEISNIEAKSEGLRNALTKDLTESSAYVSKLRAAYLGIAEANDELKTAKPGSEDFKDYTEQLNTFLSKYPELEKFKDALGYYDKAPEFVKSDEWLDFLATLPQAHTYLESIGYDFDKINRVSNETPVSTNESNQVADAINNQVNAMRELESENEVLQQQAHATASAEQELMDAVDYWSHSDTKGIDNQTESMQKLEAENESLRQSLQASADEMNHLNEEYGELQRDLEGEKDFSSSLWGDLYEQRQLTEELQAQNEELKERNKALENGNQPNGDIKSSFKDEQQVVDGVINQEATALSRLRDAINLVIDAVNEKTQAFEKEGQMVDQVVYKEELTAIEVLTGWITQLKEEIDKVSGAFSGIKLDIDMTNTDTNAVTKFIKSLSNLKDDKIDDKLISVFTRLDDFAQAVNKIKIDDSSILASINNLLSKSKELSILSDALKENKKKIDEVIDDSSDKPKNYKDKYSSKLEDAIASTGDDIAYLKKQGKNTESYFEKYEDLYVQLKDLSSVKLDFVSEDDYKELLDLLDAIRAVKKEANLAINKEVNAKSIQKYLGQVNDVIAKNNNRRFKKTDEYKDLVELQNILKSFDTSKPQSELDALGQKVLEVIARVKGLDESFRGGGFLSNFRHRLADMNAKFFAQYFSFQDMIRYAREAFNVVQDLNIQMVELAKVSEQSLKQIEGDFNSYANVAKDLGATISDTISATADWARMGYNVPDSKQLAEVALLYKNVGDGIDITSANQSLISTLQGYQMQANEAEHIVDVFNEVANNYAIDTAGIGEALQRSAASLNAANTSLEQSVALVTAANTVVQNPESVGTTFKTLSARIRGAKTELADLGEEEDEFTETTSKLQGLIKSLTGFDILESDQKTFKSIYDILIGIGDEWQNLSDIERASLGEALAGKRNANTLYAILDNIDTLKNAYETAENAAGSARREQENFEQGIEYSVNRAKAALQELAYDALDSDMLKGLIDFGTKAINLIDTLIDKFGLLSTAIAGIAGVWGAKNLNLFGYNNNDGLTIGGFKLSDFTKGINGKKLLGQDSNQDFLNMVESTGVTGEQIQQLADTYNAFGNKVHPIIVQHAKDWDNLGDSVKENIGLTESFVSQNQTGFQKLTSIGKGFVGTLKTIGGTALKMLGNAAISAGISWIVSTGFGLLIKGLDKVINKAKYIKEAAEEAKQTIEATNTELNNTRKEIDSKKERYAELAQKVGNLGTLGQNQGGLSNDEYKEFLDISTQLAELFPRLTIGYDDNGVAILNLSGNVDTIVGSLNELVKAEEAAANRTVLESMDEIWLDYSTNIDKTRESLNKLNAEFNGTKEDWIEGYDQAYEAFNEAITSQSPVLFDFNYKDSEGYFTQALNRAGIEWNYLQDFDENRNLVYDFSKLSEDQIDAIKDAFSNIRSEYLAQVKLYEDTINDANREIGTYMSQAIKTTDYYDSLSDVEKQLMEAFIMNFDFETLQDQFNGDWTQTYNAFQTTLRESFGSVSDADRILIQKYYSDLFAIDMSSGSYQENIEKIHEYARLIAAILGDEFSEIDILELLGFKNPDDKIVQARNHAGYTYGRVTEEQAQRNAEINDWIDSMSGDELDLFMTLSIDEDASVQEMQKAFKRLQKIADGSSINVEVKASEAVDSMADAKTAITSLEELWNQTVQDTLALGKDKKYLDANGNVIKQLNDKNQAVGFADPATINSVESAFSKFSKELDDSGNKSGANKINEELEKFERTLVEFPGDADKAQKAINNLITAYIDQTDIIKNLTEENAEWSIAQLEAYGVTNAQDVVMTRLDTTTRRLVKDFKEATSALYNLTDAQIDNYDAESMSSVQGQLNTMFTTQMGEQTITPDFDPTWIIQNLDLLKEAAAGSVDAMWQVQQEASKRIVAQIEIDAPKDSDVKDIQNQINGLIDNFDIQDVEVGTSLDTNPMIQGLNDLVDAGVITRDAMNAILSSIGVSPTITWEDVPITVTGAQEIVDAYTKAGNSTAGIQTAKGVAGAQASGATVGTVRMPRLGYSATNSGVGAKYAAPSSGSSSSGGGGGGGGGGSSSEPTKPKEEAEESFDWIEVAIQRIEEEIARLDKVVGNSYDFWVKRNEALLAEMEKTRQEIKAQEIAYSEYLRNANAVQVNNGKGLNADDYGENDSLVKAQDERLLAEAKKAWATGEYQKKVQEGLMTGKDIETIQNHFLAETIKTYQELYNKAISAQDAVQDLKIKLGDLARTNFDHVKGEAEDAIAYFESYADLINARIERTEEKGYFATKTFQGALISYEQERLKVLKKEYDDLIAKRDEATRTKAILPYSEEFNKMNQEILEVGKSIEEATTNLVKFNNEMRQHDWDVFDFTQERINNIAEEFDFLIDLLDNQKLYDDYGLFNSRGWADSALHAGKYNAYMEQALQYAKEREKIEADLKKDNADKNLIERREELIKLQQESITNAYAEKEAVKSLVEEGKRLLSINLFNCWETLKTFIHNVKMKYA